jgi:hypothetical protein
MTVGNPVEYRTATGPGSDPQKNSQKGYNMETKLHADEALSTPEPAELNQRIASNWPKGA